MPEVRQCRRSDWATRPLYNARVQRSPRTSRRAALSRHAPQCRGPASVQQLRRQPWDQHTCEVCAWGGLSAAGISTRCDASRMSGEPKRPMLHAHARLGGVGSPRSTAPWASNAAKYGDKFVGGLSCFFELSFTWSARSASVCAPCLAAYEHSALLHTGLSGRFGIGRSTRCTGKIYHFAHNRARKCFVLLLNADVSRAVGHVGAPGLSFTWRTTRSSLRRPYPG
jgi:hypothetical protein